MTTEFYTRMGARASALIKKRGRIVQLRRRPYGEVQDRNCWVVRTQFDPHVIDGDLIMWTDHRYLMSTDIRNTDGSVGEPPDREKDRLLVDGEELQIVTAPPLKPAEIVLYYDVQARL